MEQMHTNPSLNLKIVNWLQVSINVGLGEG